MCIPSALAVLHRPLQTAGTTCMYVQEASLLSTKTTDVTEMNEQVKQRPSEMQAVRAEPTQRLLHAASVACVD